MDTDKITPEPAPGQAEPAAGPRMPIILLIDDEDYVRELIGAILSLEGYQVLQASSPAEALRHSEEAPAPIDLILAEVIMPLVSGPELVQAIRRTHPGAKAIFLSGWPSVVNDKLGIDPADWLLKPFTPKVMVARIAELLRAPGKVGA